MIAFGDLDIECPRCALVLRIMIRGDATYEETDGEHPGHITLVANLPEHECAPEAVSA